MASPDSAAKSAAASATSAAASAQAAATALENAVEVAGLPTEAAAQTYNIQNDPGVKGAIDAHVDGEFTTALGDGGVLKTYVQQYVVTNDLGTSDGQIKAIVDDATSNGSKAIATKFGAVTAEKTYYVTPRGNDANDGLTLGQAKATLGAAMTAAGATNARFVLGVGTFTMPTGGTLRSGSSIHGTSPVLTTLTYTGAGTAIGSATPGTRSYNPRLSDFTLEGPGSGTATIGIDLDSVSDADLSNILVRSFGTGVRIKSAINGGAVYNRLDHVTASTCGTGFAIHALGSNCTVLTGCRANACTTGVDITDANNTEWIGGAIESNTTGVRVTATSNALADSNMFLGCRFENNATAWNVTSANVRDFQMLNPQIFGTYTIADSGTRTRHTGSASTTHGAREFSLAALPAGSWRYERTVSGGSETPAFVVRDSNTGSGVAVTYQAETERASGYFYRGVRGGVTYFDIDAYGNFRAPQGGYFDLTERASDPAAPAANGARIYLKDNGAGKTQLCVRFATGAVQVISTEP